MVKLALLSSRIGTGGGVARISIVTPSYNQAEFLERTIESVLSQNVDVEYIVVDGCSSDGSVDILKRYATRACVIVEKDNGQGDAIAKGFALANGEILAWLNSDDMYLPGALEKVIKFFDRGVEFLYGNIYIVNSLDTVLRRRVAIPVDFYDLYYGNYVLPQEATFFSRRLYNASGGINPLYHYALDYDLWLRMALLSSPRWVNEPLSCFRFHKGQKSRDKNRLIQESRKIRQRLNNVAAPSTCKCLKFRLLLLLRTIVANIRGEGLKKTVLDVMNKKLGRLP